MSAAGRLPYLTQFAEGRLKIAETRLVPSAIRLPDWADDAGDPCLTLTLRTITIVPASRCFAEAELDLAAFGEHSLARRYERGAGGEDYDVGQDCHEVGKHYSALTASSGAGFRVPVAGGGMWVGSVVLVGAAARPLLMVRTFVEGAPLRGFAFADVVSRVTRDGVVVR